MMTKALVLACATALLACSSSTSEAPPVTAPGMGTGYLAFVIAGNKAKIFTPVLQNLDGWTPIAVLDPAVGDGQNGLVKFIDLGPTLEPTSVGGDGNDVVVSDGGSPTVYFIDAANERVTGSAQLPPGEPFFVSGSNFYSSGVVVDSARRRAWVSFSAGIAEYNLDTRLLTATYASPPPENFAFDRAAGLLYLPFYLCDPNGTTGGCDPFTQPGGPDITDSIVVVDVAKNITSMFVDPAATDTHAPLGFGPDAAALDPALKLLVVAIDSPAAVKVLDSTPVVDAATLTCRLPLRATITMPGPEYTAITVDPASHLAIVAEEGGAGIAFVDLTRSKPWPGNALAFSLPDKPTGETWVTRGDPHGITLGAMDNRAYAFVYSMDRAWMARIDVAKVAALTSADQAAFATAVTRIQVPPAPAQRP